MRRLRVVQARLRDILDTASPGRIRVLSLCAGDGRDLVGVLRGHPRARDIEARLIDASATLVARGHRRATSIPGARLTFLRADASTTTAAEGAVPADLVLLCGIFGNISDDDVRRTIRAAPMLCAPDAWVIWTRGRGHADLTPQIRRWFRSAGFQEQSFEPVPGSKGTVGVHRLAVAPAPFRRGITLFTFLPRRRRPSRGWSGRARPGRGSPRRPEPPARSHRSRRCSPVE